MNCVEVRMKSARENADEGVKSHKFSQESKQTQLMPYIAAMGQGRRLRLRTRLFDFHTLLVLAVAAILTLPCSGLVQATPHHSLHLNHNHRHHHHAEGKAPHPHHPHHHSHHQPTAPTLETVTDTPDSSSEGLHEIGPSSTTPSASTAHQQPELHMPQIRRNLILRTSQEPQDQPEPPQPPQAAVATPLPPSHFPSSTTPQYEHSDGGTQRRPSSTNPLQRSKYSSHSEAMDRHDYLHHRPEHQAVKPQQEYDYDLLQQQLPHRPHPKPKAEDADYYDEYGEDENTDDDDEEDDNTDGFIDDTDNNLSERSYARITRSKMDDDYIDDEPYRNAVDDEEMQGDAPPGVLTEQKYLEVGNEKAVHQARERYIQEQKRPRTPHELATEHWQRMIHATKCRKPLPRVIPVSNNTSKRYEPYATILHRCGEDTGCCGSTASVCTVKRFEIVMVYVFSYDFNYRKEIEALPMQNHTECHCVNRASLLQDGSMRGKRSGGSWQYVPHPPPSSSYYNSDIKKPHSADHILNCHCPRHFSVLEENVERYAHLPKPHMVFTRKCRCDCQQRSQTCMRLKRGEEGFSLGDRKCIMEHNCKPPVCAFGDYSIASGRCPPHQSHSKSKL